MAKKEKAEKVTSFEELMKKYGKDNLLIEGDYVLDSNDRIPSGSLRLDYALGWHQDCPNGGWPCGGISEIFGPESSGKTTLLIHAMANAQRKYPDKKVGLIDVENSFNMEYAMEYSGLSRKNFVISQPGTAEEALSLMKDMISTEAFSLVGIDSVAAMVPLMELQGEVGAAQIGLKARLMSQQLPQIAKDAKDTNTVVIFVNQERDAIGVMSYGGPKQITTGGKALRYYTSTRVDITRIGAVKEGDDVIGNKTKVKLAKNKTAPPFREVEFDIIYGEGVDGLGEVMDIGIENGMIERKGTAYYIVGGKTVQGRHNAKQALKENKELYDKIYTAYVESIFPKKTE